MRPKSGLILAAAVAAATAGVATVTLAPQAGATTTASKASAAQAQAATTTIPAYSHVVVVMEENHAYNEIIGSSSAPYINSLANGGALMTQSFAVGHPSEPNYLAIFAGSTFGVTSDKCPLRLGTAANLGSELLAAGDSFKGYSEGLPSSGSTVCTSGAYARKHVPWVNFSNVPATDSVPFTAFPSSANYASLPKLSFVIPNLNDDMHDGTIAQGDTWLNNNLSAYATWAKANNSLLVVTWDEDDSSQSNQVATVFYGANVLTGQYSEKINHYNVLATLEQMFGLAKTGNAATATPITDIWG